MVSIHIIDDDSEIRELLRELFESDEYEVSTFNSAEDAHPYILRENPDLEVDPIPWTLFLET